MVDILLRSDQFEDVLVEAFLGGRFVVWTQRKFEIAVMVCREFHSDVDGAAGWVLSNDDALAVGPSVFVGSRYPGIL